METAPSGRLSPAERRAYALGRRDFERGDVDAALEHLEPLLRTRRSFADVHYMVGALLERKGDLPSATRSLREALRLNPDYVEALLALASVYERQGDFDRSRALAERARGLTRQPGAALDPTTRGKLANKEADLADAYREAGQLADAIETYRRALDRCPSFHDIRHRLGIALREAGLPEQSLAEFRRVLRANPAFLDASVQLGLTLYGLGRGADARSEWQAVLERDPDRDDAKMYLRLVRDASTT